MGSSKAHHKDNPLLGHFRAALGSDFNLALTRFVCEIVCALITARTVIFGRLALAFSGSHAKAVFVHRRIQHFMAGFHLAASVVYRLVMGLLDHRGISTRSWIALTGRWGSFHINILALGTRHKGCAILVLFSVLPKKGAPNTAERIALMERFIRLFGRVRIGSLTTDREFIGADWFTYLTTKGMSYYIRLRNNTLISTVKGGAVGGRTHFKNLRLGQFHRHRRPVRVFGVNCLVTAPRVRAQGGKTEMMIIASFDTDHCPFANYRERWQVETMFKAMTSSGFNINRTHKEPP
jgi:hypothetical protein